MRMFLMLALVMLGGCATSGGSAGAGSVEVDGDVSWEGMSRGELKERCDGGAAGACEGLAAAYYTNRDGGGLDVVQASVYFEKACEGGNLVSCTQLGGIYLGGVGGIAVDVERGVKFYEKACEGGDMVGCSNLGNVYVTEDGVPVDFGRAAALYEKACEGGYGGGCYHLGLMYRRGQGFGQDAASAALLYERARAEGFLEASTELGLLYVMGEGVEQDVARAADYFTQACEGELLDGCHNLVATHVLYNTEVDLAWALNSYEELCSLRLAYSCFSAGEMYAEGQGIDVDVERAAGFYKKACEGGHEEGCEKVGGL